MGRSFKVLTRKVRRGKEKAKLGRGSGDGGVVSGSVLSSAEEATVESLSPQQQSSPGEHRTFQG